MTLPRRRWLRLLAAPGAAAALAGWTGRVAAQARRPAPEERWAELKPSLFGSRAVLDDAGEWLALEVPARAEDAAIVPIAVKARQPQTPARWVRRLHLVVDNNPSPMGVVVAFTPDSGRADLETRLRIEDYSSVRAVAELDDGRLVMTSRYIKASGGCSAPAGKDLAEAMASLGRMRLRVDGAVVAGRPAQAQLMVSHPNVSGLAIDQLTRLAPKPQFVRQIAVRYAGRPVLQADVDFSLSENPSLRFQFLARDEGELVAEVVDTEDRRFTTRLAVRAGPGDAG
ncbi:quinoprotein dehydrogenase-associated SoxYZ-like carrier [Piscinibacter sakaiensis]|uniref:Sulfur oxidation protein SoxY n=1 Tax=Piscinibacter sakaiensis TaxID=1547922 RepID=A0A0K8P569_PISS1|nr:quinoprotein dehydrogenase-associated SoxYZ-like carrier [Piscinibacter sakaiensis]GAP37721.1 hypothetical protein ISF6_3666 [Piscinibacter sakaiensis]